MEEAETSFLVMSEEIDDSRAETGAATTPWTAKNGHGIRNFRCRYWGQVKR